MSLTKNIPILAIKTRLLWLYQDSELEKMQTEMEELKQTVQEKEAKVNRILLLYHAICI